MKSMTTTRLTSEACKPCRIESAPSDGPTVRSSKYLIEAGSAPLRSSSARSCASCCPKRPSITPESSIRLLITGAESTRCSSTMAVCRPTFYEVPFNLCNEAARRLGALTEQHVGPQMPLLPEHRVDSATVLNRRHRPAQLYAW